MSFVLGAMKRFLDVKTGYDTKGYFDYDEMRCNCGCRLYIIDIPFIKRLNIARYISGVAYPISSWTRCPTWNKHEGGSDTSSHLTGKAGDIKCAGSLKRFKILFGLLLAGFTRVGIAKSFIHADEDMEKPKPRLWVY